MAMFIFCIIFSFGQDWLNLNKRGKQSRFLTKGNNRRMGLDKQAYFSDCSLKVLRTIFLHVL